jgi:hypothetical protein
MDAVNAQRQEQRQGQPSDRRADGMPVGVQIPPHTNGRKWLTARRRERLEQEARRLVPDFDELSALDQALALKAAALNLSDPATGEQATRLSNALRKAIAAIEGRRARARHPFARAR